MPRHEPRRRVPAGAAALALAAALLSVGLGAPAHAQAGLFQNASLRAKQVVVILTPFLTWDDLTRPGAEALRALALRSSIANMNAITADPRWPRAAGGALTIGAGRWTAAPIGDFTLSSIASANASSLNPPEIGALGQVIHDAGLKTAAIGTVAHSRAATDALSQPAVLAAMDASGRVDLTVTDEALLATDSAAPFGLSSDPAEVASSIRLATERGASLIVVDPGDLEREHDAASSEERDEWGVALRQSHHAAAVASTSRTVGAVLTQLDEHDPPLVLLVSPATDKPYYQPPYLGPIMVSRGPLAGAATSSSTHRLGLVTNLDVAPTILEALGLEATSTMIGAPMQARLEVAPRLPSSAIAALATIGTSAGAIDYVRDLYFIRDFALASELAIALVCVIALLPALRRARPLARGLLLLALCVPLGAWLMFALVRRPLTPAAVLLAFAAATLLAFALVGGLALWRRTRPEVALLAVSSATTLVICLDQWLGHPIESGLFSYSIRAGWRYYGMGNEGAALLVGASVLAVALVCDLAENTSAARPLRLGLMPLVGVVCLLTAAAPFAGANAGVAVWGVFAYGIAWARLNGVRFSWKLAASIVVVVALLVGALAAIDMASGRGETHIGRFFGQLAGGDLGAVQALVVRKAANNIGYLPQTPYTLLCVVLVAALAALWWLRGRPLARTVRERPGVSAALLGLLVGGVVATLTEDSGVVMPALMLYAGALPMIYLTLEGCEPSERRGDMPIY